MIKKLLTLLAAGLLAVSMSMTAWAGEWKQDTTGWWYQNDNGSYPKNQWQEINGKQYYFGSNGYMLSNTTTPDGYKVGADGAWMEGTQNEASKGYDNTEKVNPPVNCINVFEGGKGTTWNFEGDTVDEIPMKAIVNGQYVKDKWVCWKFDDGTTYWYYFDSNGNLFKNGITPDNYKTNEYGLWFPDYSQTRYDEQHTYRVGQEGGYMNCSYGVEGTPEYDKEKRIADTECSIIDPSVSTFQFSSSLTNINPIGHRVYIVGFQDTKYGLIALAKGGEPISYTLEYDKPFSLDFTGTHPTAAALSQYCIQNDIVIQIWVEDTNISSNSNLCYEWDIAYANGNSKRVN